MNILDPHLSYDKGSTSTDLTISFRIQWNEDELDLRGRYMCKVILYDADPGSDDEILTHHLDHIECDGHTRETSISHTFNVSNDTLNVDGRGHGRGTLKDEIYAKIYITANVGIATTNQISTQF